MSENSKKRCRKSKLVPRECAAIDDENIEEMQEPKAKLTKIKLEKAYTQTPHVPAPIEFSIKVEVEEFEEIHKTKEHKIAEEQHLRRIVVNEDEFKEYLKKSFNSTSSLPDKIIEVDIKNDLVKSFEWANESRQETMLVQALNQWRIWKQTSPNTRMAPFTYKCYICTLSWWVYSNFYDHVLNHDEDDLKINLELIGYETNLVAHGEELPKTANIPAEGDCWKCCQEYSKHTGVNNESKEYICECCNKTLLSCYHLKIHEGTCDKYRMKYYKDRNMDYSEQSFVCILCPMSCYTKEDIDKHIMLYHDVRSDEPIAVRIDSCTSCNLNFPVYKKKEEHDCPSIIFGTCNYCFKSFPSKVKAEAHMIRSSGVVYCKICNKMLERQCLEPQHLLVHSQKYTLMFRCVKCSGNVLFLDKEAVSLHAEVKHDVDMNRYTCFYSVFVPKSYVANQLNDLQEDNVTVSDQIQIKQEINTEIGGYGKIIVKEELDYEESDDFEEMLSNVFQTSQELSGTSLAKDIKTEIVDPDDIYEDDIIVLNQKEKFEFNNLEPEIILDSGRKLKRVYQCKRCDFNGYHKEFKEHQYVCTRNKYTVKCFTNHLKYDCTKCNKSFKSINSYLYHFESHNYEATSCPQCMLVCGNLSTLTRHVNIHIRQLIVKVFSIDETCTTNLKNNYQCKNCKMFIEVDNMFQHWEKHLDVNSVKVDVRRVTEMERDSSALEPELLKDVIDIIDSNELKKVSTKIIKDCNVCGRHFERQNECKRHIIEHLLQDAYANRDRFKSLKCQICYEEFEKADKYKYHMRNHASLPVYQCALCDKSFSDSSNFTKHKKVHNLSSYVCDVCKKKFQKKDTLIKHMEEHNPLQPFYCECNKIFYSKSALKKHRRSLHDKTTPKFRCPVCRRMFFSLKDKWDHQWEVHKESKKKADCPVCDKSFRKLQDVRNHIKNEHQMDLTVINTQQNFPVKAKEKGNEDIEEFLRTTEEIEYIEQNGETLVIYE